MLGCAASAIDEFARAFDALDDELPAPAAELPAEEAIDCLEVI